MGRTKSYEGEGIVVRFEARRCIHAGECVRGLPAVFNPANRPWIDASGAAADRLAQAVERCPSGALTYERTDGGPAEKTPSGPSLIEAVKDGPLHVRGAFDVVGPDGETVTTGPRAALCRCGASGNKPFCDNSHVEAGFTDPS